MSKPPLLGFFLFNNKKRKKMGWKIIEIENGEKLSLFLENLVIYKELDKITISINDIDVLLINNYKINLSVQLINELCNKNVLTILCDNNYLPKSLIIPIIGNYNTVKVLQNQINWNHVWKSNIWKQIIGQKINNQKELIKKIFKDSKNNEIVNKLINLKKDLKDYDITNREGHASKIYWHTLFGINFKRFNDDYLNKLLNYGYTILRAYFTRAIIKKGLDPRISIFHKSFHNYFALSSDLMEPFRVIIDVEVWKIWDIGIVDFYKDKNTLLLAFNKKIIINNKKQYINNAIDLFVDCFVNNSDIPQIEYDYEKYF
ncbi:MAG: type II CRISPR-associated endonuclease Cas1 [Metamycoplasmataceae bacterium]